MIIPPSSLNLRSTVRRRLYLCSVIPPNWPQWNPLIVVGKLAQENYNNVIII